jgi:hypothetical protein
VTLAQLIYQISTNREFASAFRAEPQRQLAAAGVKLGEAETLALVRVLETEREAGRSLSETPDWPAWFSDLF